MKRAGEMWTLDDDRFFQNIFRRTGNRFEPEYLDRALTYVENRRTAIDCGAHYGSWSIQMAEHFQHVIALEPRKDIYECLVRNTGTNRNIQTFQKGVSNKQEFVTVGPGKNYHNSGCSTVIGEGKDELITIDSLELINVDFIKLDIEGYELFGLMGAKETLLREKPIVYFENKGFAVYQLNNKSCPNFLESLGAVRLDALPGPRERDLIYGWNE